MNNCLDVLFHKHSMGSAAQFCCSTFGFKGQVTRVNDRIMSPTWPSSVAAKLILGSEMAGRKAIACVDGVKGPYCIRKCFSA